MKFKPLGNTGLAVSIVGLGTVKLGRDQGVKYPTAFEIPDDRQALQLINQARDLGINLIDTAPAYGSSEERLGKLLAGQRDHWLIATKTGEEFDGGESRFDFSSEHTRFSVERSLRRLNTETIDIVLVHSDGNDLDIINHWGTLDVLADLKKAGKIRSYGMSSKTLAGGLLAAEKSDLVMVTYNLNERAEVDVLDYCLANNKGCVIKKALASGHLCESAALDPVQASMDFVFAHRGVSAVIIGTINQGHLRHNVDCALKACQ